MNAYFSERAFIYQEVPLSFKILSNVAATQSYNMLKHKQQYTKIHTKISRKLFKTQGPLKKNK